VTDADRMAMFKRLPGRIDGARPVRTVLVVILAGLMMSGCVTADFGSTFTAEGVATHSLTVLFQRGGIADLDLRRLERQLEAAEARASADGYTVEPISTSSQLGIRISGTTRDVADTGASLNGLYNSLVRDAGGPIAPFSGGFDRESSAIGGTTFVLTLAVDGELLFRSVQEFGPGNRQLQTRAGVDDIVSFSYTATMPGTIRSTDGETDGSSTVRWHIPIEGTTMLHATSTAGRDTPWGVIVLTVGGALLLVALVSGALAWLMLHRHRRGRATIPLVQPVSVEGAEITASADPPTVTVQDVSASLARAVEQVIEGTPTPDVLEAEVVESAARTEAEHGVEPERS
jgi:hypothetical protein